MAYFVRNMAVHDVIPERLFGGLFFYRTDTMVGQRRRINVTRGVRQELPELREQIALVLKQLGNLTVHFLFRQMLPTTLTLGRFLQSTLFFLVGMQNFQETFVLLRLPLETILQTKNKKET